MIPIEPLRHIYNDPSINREYLIHKLYTLKVEDLITARELEYLKYLIRKENENAQRANGCTY